MKPVTIAFAAIAVALGMGVALNSAMPTAWAHGVQQSDSQRMGHGMMGHGMMGRGMMMGPHGMDPGMAGHGMMGRGMMGRGTMGHGMMMGPHGMNPGAMGPGMGRQGWGPGMMAPLAKDLSVADVKHMLEHRLAWRGNPNLKIGKVEEKDADTIVAEIVTKDGSLVRRYTFDRHTGRMQPAG